MERTHKLISSDPISKHWLIINKTSRFHMIVGIFFSDGMLTPQPRGSNDSNAVGGGSSDLEAVRVSRSSPRTILYEHHDYRVPQYHTSRIGAFDSVASGDRRWGLDRWVQSMCIALI